MADETSPFRDLSATRLFPGVRLFRGAVLATDGRKLILAALGLMLTDAGWRTLDRILPGPPTLGVETATWWSLPPASLGISDQGIWRVAGPARAVVTPFVAAFSTSGDGWAFVHALLASAWVALVWGVFGGAIARIAAVELACSERISLTRSLAFASKKLLPLVGGPLVPMLGVTIFALVCVGFGVLYRIPGTVGPVVAGAFLFVPLLAGLFMALILAGLAVGWPLIHASVAAQADDGFDALSRTYAYVHQRPVQYAGYALLAWMIGVVGFFFVTLFSRAVVQLTLWGLAFSAPPDRLAGAFGTALRSNEATAAGIHSFWLSAVALLTNGWVYSFFWTSAAIVYLLLRRSVDSTPLSEVALPPRQDARPNHVTPTKPAEPMATAASVE